MEIMPGGELIRTTLNAIQVITDGSPRQARARCVPDQPVNAGNSRSLPDNRYTGSPAYRQADPLRKPIFEAGDQAAGLRTVVP